MTTPADGNANYLDVVEGLTAADLLKACAFPVCLVDRDLRVLYTSGHWVCEADDGACVLHSLPEPSRSRFEAAATTVLALAGLDAHMPPRSIDITPRVGAAPVRVLLSAVRDGAGTVVAVLCVATEPEERPCDSEEDAARLDVARQLAATLNHEINNPLFVISATLEDLLAESPEPALERRLRAALEAVWRVSRAVKLLTEIRQVVSTAYIGDRSMVDLEASQHPPDGSS